MTNLLRTPSKSVNVVSNVKSNFAGSAAQHILDGFRMLVDTSLAGSPNTQFIIPKKLTKTYNYTWETSDGQSGTNVLDTDQTITFPSPGKYIISIHGAFPRIQFNNVGDKLKLLEIQNWGPSAWPEFSNAFWGCSNLEVTAGDIPNLSSITNFTGMFKGCTGMTHRSDLNGWKFTKPGASLGNMFDSGGNPRVELWDLINVVNPANMFRFNALFNRDISGWRIPNETSYAAMFFFSTIFNQDLSEWDYSSTTNLSQFLSLTSYSNENYGKLLQAIATKPHQINVPLEVSAKYPAYAKVHRDQLVSDGWTISDNGAE